MGEKRGHKLKGNQQQSKARNRFKSDVRQTSIMKDKITLYFWLLMPILTRITKKIIAYHSNIGKNSGEKTEYKHKGN